MAASHRAPYRPLAAVLAALLLVAGCDDESLQDVPPPPVPSGGALFQSYVAIGNSITAGFQSGGINDSTQLESYAVLLARQMGHTIGQTFNPPLMNPPGCPAPFVNIFTQERLSDIPCALRAAPVPNVVHNVAVPGAAVIDALNNLDPTSSPNTLTSFFLGGRTQVEAAADARPTFVTVFIGNNDVLGAITSTTNPGDPALITPVDEFSDNYEDMVDDLDDIGTIQGGVLIGVVQAGLAPFATQGLAWAGFEAAFDAQTAPLNALDVNPNCAMGVEIPGTTDTVYASIPFPLGGAMLQEATAKIDSVQAGTLSPLALVPVTVDCSVPEVIDVNEALNIAATVAQYNAAISDIADDVGWVFVDPNPLLQGLLADPTAIAPFPAFPGTVADTTITVTAPFGSAISRDGIHPSGSTHKTFANALIAAINAAYGTSLAPVP